ncbi:MAG TPA: hypothetical protein VGF76_25345 [Polyangiaceae bacterium]|jgi:hypothetical protein
MCLLAVEPCAFAQTDDDRAGARVAATEGVKASNEKRWADAADLFTRAESLVHSPVHLLYLARAQEKLGHLVKARENYTRVIREHLGADSPDAFKQAQASAQQEASALEPRLAAITVKLGGQKGDVTVTMDGEKVPPALVGLPLPVDPGSHSFQAAGTDLKSDPVAVTVTEGGKDSLTLVVKSAPGTVAPFSTPPAATPAAAAGPAATPTAAVATPTGTGPSTRPTPTGVYVGTAVTGALVVGAAVTGVLALSKHSDYNKANNGSDPSKADSLKSSGQTLNLVTDIFVGGAVVAAGVTAYFFFSRPEVPAQQSARLSITPVVGPNVAALSLSGRF